MKGRMWLAACAACVSAAAPAATIIQTDSEQGALKGFSGFDAALGTLNKVTLNVAVAKSRVWRISVAAAAPVTTSVSWVVDGDWRLASDNAALGNPLVPLAGTGTSVVTLDRFADGRAFGFFAVAASGSATLDFDPARFLNRDTVFNGFDLGHNGNVGDTSFTALPAGGALLQLGGSCFVSGEGAPSAPIGEDFCGSANYTLTYDYTPAGAVPEPATWAMMLAGFAATGAALRRRRHTAVA